MGTLTGLFSNNRRREAQAVVGTLPYAIESADLREGTAAVVATNELYTLLNFPDNVVITSVSLVVETGCEFAAGTALVKIGSTTVIPATTVATAGITASDDCPLLLEGDNALTVTPASLTVTDANADARLRVVVEYIDFDRATMSYIGED